MIDYLLDMVRHWVQSIPSTLKYYVVFFFIFLSQHYSYNTNTINFQIFWFFSFLMFGGDIMGMNEEVLSMTIDVIVLNGEVL